MSKRKDPLDAEVPVRTWVCECGMVNLYPDRQCYICASTTRATPPQPDYDETDVPGVKIKRKYV